jgi:MOSC domain-containing protein YiiM
MSQPGKILSVQVGQPRELTWMGRTMLTSIFKEPVAGRVMLRTLNLDGDRQADLTVHGGREKAIYLYPSEHYELWRKEMPGVNLPWGAFGENLTITGLLEPEMHIGDRLRVGDAELAVTKPRFPCTKLQAKFQSEEFMSRFLHSGRSGFYCEVLREGLVGAGDAIESLGNPNLQAETIAEMVRKRAKTAD